MEVKINKDIREYKETMFFGLTVRQFVFAVLACAAAAAAYFGFDGKCADGVLSWLCVLAALPFVVAGFVRYNGMPVEKVVFCFIKSEILTPRVLLFRGENKYMPDETRTERKGKKSV